MRIIRGIVFAIITMLTLLGQTANVASANPGTGSLVPDAIFASVDPGDPGFPPDQ